MTAALALRHRGIEVAVLEAEPQDRTRPGSRAIFVHKASLKTLETISPGLSTTLAEHGLVWPVKRTLWRGKEVYVQHYPSPKPGTIPPFTSLPQVQAERFLFEACQAAGVEFVWSAEVVKVDAGDDGVRIATAHGDTWTADYVIGADGARSGVRKAVGIEMEGTRSANTFLVVDVKEDMDNPLPLERVFHYQHPAMGGRNVLYVPFSGGWRVDLQLFDGDDPEAYGSKEGVRGWLTRVMDKKYADRVTWVSTYQFLQVVSKEFADVHRRVLLVGEAAHLFAPFGARGMNSGIADAVSAADAIGTALSASDLAQANAAVAKFAEERRIAACYNRDAAGVALHHIQGSSLSMNLKRQMAAAVAPVWRKAGRWLDEGPYGPKSGPPTLASKY